LYDLTYKAEEKFAEGTYGLAYLGKNIENDKEKIVIKIEKEGKQISTQIYEALVLTLLNKPKFSCSNSIPKVKCFGKIGEQKYMVMEQLGPSLENI